jgi:FlaA1/EpsC-like NDP-sugar epimerase
MGLRLFTAHLRRPWLRRGVKLALDTILAGLAWALSIKVFVQNDLKPGSAFTWMALALVTNLIFQQTRQHYRLIGFQDAVRLAGATMTLGILGVLTAKLAPSLHSHFNLEAVAAASLTTGGLWVLLRATIRAQHDYSRSQVVPPGNTRAHRTLIVGAGHAGLLVSQELKRHSELGSRIVGFIDDALDKQGVRIQGSPVLGPSELLSEIIVQFGVTQVILAIPSASGEVIRKLSNILRPCGVQIKTVPGIFDLLGPRTWKPELRDVSIEDLLRREPVNLDQSALSLVLEDSVVLITGGGGSIGSELARQVATFRPARIVLLGRGENSLWEAERSLRKLFPNQALSLELCDIRNTIQLGHVFNRTRPQVVLHTAAHKHVPYLEMHPAEAVQNNIFGTQNVLEASIAAGVHTFVNISTDKAVNPTNVLGATKFIAEHLVTSAAATASAGSRYVSVRFGNVLGSRGSVIPVFQDQIRSGGPLTVTHPDMTRYFMTIPEASQLVLQAGVLGDTGKVYVLDMGQPVRILDLASDMARLSGFTPGQDIDIQFSGIRPGEKLYEELFTASERSHTGVHSKVFEAVPEHPDPERIEAGLDLLRQTLAAPENHRQTEILKCLRHLVPSYTPSPNGLGRFAEDAKDPRGSGQFTVLRPASEK